MVDAGVGVEVGAAETVKLRDIAPELPQAMMDKLTYAIENFKWREINAYVTEEHVFRRSYWNIASFYYGTAGRIVLDIFKEYEVLAEAFVLHCLQNEDMIGEPLKALLVGEIATGPSQAFLRPITLRSFTNAAYEHTPTTTGKYNLIPTTSGSETATTKEQGWLIMGWYEPYARVVIPYDEIQVTLSDSEATRRPLYTKGKDIGVDGNNMLVFKEATPKIVEPGGTLDVDVYIRTPNIKFGLWPIGIEVIRADSSKAAGPTS